MKRKKYYHNFGKYSSVSSSDDIELYQILYSSTGRQLEAAAGFSTDAQGYKEVSVLSANDSQFKNNLSKTSKCTLKDYFELCQLASNCKTAKDKYSLNYYAGIYKKTAKEIDKSSGLDR